MISDTGADMVPEINVIDENPPIFDLEWMDQCVDKVSHVLYIGMS